MVYDNGHGNKEVFLKNRFRLAICPCVAHWSFAWPNDIRTPFIYSASGLYVRSSGGAKRWRSRNIVF